MTYQQPTADHPVEIEVNGTPTKFDSQIALGKALHDKYRLRSTQDITSCSTCHR